MSYHESVTLGLARDIQVDLREMRAETNAAFARIEIRLGVIEQRLSAIERRLELTEGE